jgi:HlyD family secretion protein
MIVKGALVRVLCAFLAAAALPALGACGRKPTDGVQAAAATQGQARTVRVVRVESRQMQGGLDASGLLISREEAAVGADLGGYRVAKVYFDQGAWVKAGQPLAQLDDSLLRAQVDQQAAQTAQAQDQASRVVGLDNQGVMSAQDIASRRLTAKAQEAALAEMRVREAHMTIRAPVSGVILERNVRPGDITTASTATPMFRMIRDGLVELNAELAEDDLAKVHVGDPVQVTIPSGAVVTGHVRLVDPQVDAQTKLGHVRVLLPVRPDLRPGGFGRGSFVAVSTAGRAVPETAVRYDADGASVVVVSSDDRVTQQPVKTGRRSGGYVELLSGPPVGSIVLERAAAFVLPGDRVRPIWTAEASASPSPDVQPVRKP